MWAKQSPTSSDKERPAGGAFLCCEKWTEMPKMIIQVYWSKAHRQLGGRLMPSLTGASGYRSICELLYGRDPGIHCRKAAKISLLPQTLWQRRCCYSVQMQTGKIFTWDILHEHPRTSEVKGLFYRLTNIFRIFQNRFQRLYSWHQVQLFCMCEDWWSLDVWYKLNYLE